LIDVFWQYLLVALPSNYSSRRTQVEKHGLTCSFSQGCTEAPGHPPAVTAPRFPKGPRGSRAGRGGVELAPWVVEGREEESRDAGRVTLTKPRAGAWPATLSVGQEQDQHRQQSPV